MMYRYMFRYRSVYEASLALATVFVKEMLYKHVSVPAIASYDVWIPFAIAGAKLVVVDTYKEYPVMSAGALAGSKAAVDASVVVAESIGVYSGEWIDRLLDITGGGKLVMYFDAYIEHSGRKPYVSVYRIGDGALLGTDDMLLASRLRNMVASARFQADYYIVEGVEHDGTGINSSLSSTSIANTVYARLRFKDTVYGVGGLYVVDKKYVVERGIGYEEFGVVSLSRLARYRLVDIVYASDVYARKHCIRYVVVYMG